MNAFFVYEFFSADGQRIYIGSTEHLGARFTEHARRDWWAKVARINVQSHESRDEARSAERALISEHAPLINIHFVAPARRHGGQHKYAKQELLELKYPGDLQADVTAWLAAGVTWREIRDRVKDATGVSVVHETLRHWYGPRSAA